ncbi:beta-glucosidase H [Aspergillus clavatus NRRL 1]|uniref:Probable beta-glucosidase I n=1 Tax=Aspergillus clavatus (strain ATCC 1007 / CBS 513.65 / DSM 816 / NCTC 3887 / NRRL 1 / QM 1276 / 107) TaxID=344612 RepID=BGLI_ASPCL|nr:beta-glucosidase [Aspergillus clavatus NRRL 1]A1CA51.1 RecName: Full=Probable beta-glucosidase I; AltName: Full=Beta-D-glucoside glucohydrolase I; AltName: Full=Cellobiase I; AltName: Full=Gentiobiase I [Aspergillus clavatus NRRL 1]EAW12619.1 beta-glucosidase [Aspergillus clavatus NRRL 1]
MVQFDVEKTLEELTLGEKVALTAGTDFWHTAAVPRLNIPSLRMSDGPNGVRGTRFFNGTRAACFPCSTALGATWDTELLYEVGRLMAEESIAKGSHIILGPTINTQRSPLGGRGFESFAEDGVLSGLLAGNYCKGLQDKGVAATLKHFVCNDQEHERLAVDSIVTMRAMREIYLMPFHLAMRLCKTACVMTAYNKINGTHVSENKQIITDILRKEWGWDGLVMSDWFGTYSTSDAINAGLDLEMPGPTRWRGTALAHAVSSNKAFEYVLDERVRNVLNLHNFVEPLGIPENAPEEALNRPEDQALLRRAAAESVVLMKNEDNILPLKKEKSILVIGPNAKTAAYCGGGSASLDAYYTVAPFDGVKAKSEGEVSFSQGVYSYNELPVLGPLLKTEEGEKGFKFRVYNEPSSNPNRELLDELRLENSLGFLMDYKHPKVTSFLFYADMEGYFTPEEDGIYDFGVTVQGTGKLYIDGELVVDNSKNQRQGTAFFGNATVEEKGSKELKAGQTYKVVVEFGSAPTSDLDMRGVVVFGPGGFRFGAARRVGQEELISKAAELASQADQVVIFAGLTSEWETEGHDRDHMDLPAGSDEMISRVLDANPNAVVVIQSGTPVTMPWAHKTKALLQAWFGGNECGNGIADVLYGDVNPSAKLPLSFPVRLQDNPSYLNFRSERGRVLYGEDVYVGYRYYEKVDLAPLFPFGHGLSYTTFSRSDLSLATVPEKRQLEDGEPITATVTVTNTGDVAGAEVVQLWIVPPPTGVNRPVRELKGFAKVFLNPGESKTVEIVVEKKLATSWWDEQREKWASEKGTYKVLVTGTGDEVLKSSFEVEKTRFWLGL